MRWILAGFVTVTINAFGAGLVLGDTLQTPTNSTPTSPAIDVATREKIHRLEAQNFALARELAQTQAALADANAKLASAGLTAESQRLQAERAALETDICAAAQIAKDACVVDWAKVPAVATKKEPEKP